MTLNVIFTESKYELNFYIFKDIPRLIKQKFF